MGNAFWRKLMAQCGLCLTIVSGGCTTISTANSVPPSLPRASSRSTTGADDGSYAGYATPPAPILQASGIADATEEPISEKEKRVQFSERLKIPAELPGADAPPISLPPFDPDRPTARSSAIAELFPELGMLTADVGPAPGSASLTLADVENLALQNHPSVTQAAADIDAATGNAIQAGMYPNPSVGYEADTVGSGGTRNYQGVFLTQTIKTAGKLDLARAAANVDLMNTQLAYRKTRAELLSRVRAKFYAVLVAAESLTAAEALARFSNEVHRVQVEQLEGGQAAAYEPMQLRALAIQSRLALIQARNRYIAEWKQLAAAVGVPELPVSHLSDRADRAGPAADYDAALAYLVSSHSDVIAARNTEHRERLKLRLAEVTPIPDVEVYTAIQKDFTTPPVTRTTYNLQVGVPVPIFDRNRGGIRSAQGALMRASEESHRIQLDLTAQLADVFARYENARSQLTYHRDRILPDQARAYRGVYERHQQEPEQVGFGDVVVAQQNLQSAVSSYLTALGEQWQAYVELAALLQIEDLSQFPAAPATPGELVPIPAEDTPVP